MVMEGVGLLQAQYKYLCMETEYLNVENFRYAWKMNISMLRTLDMKKIKWKYYEDLFQGGGGLMSFPSLYTVHKLTHVVHHTNKHTYTHKQLNTHTHTNKQTATQTWFLSCCKSNFFQIH